MSEQSAAEFYNEGLEYTKSGNWDEAIECFDRAIAEDPRHVNSYNALGKAYEQKGETDAARRCWRTTLRIDPDNVTARQCLEAAKEPAQIQIRTLLWVAAVAALVLIAMIITNVVLLRRVSSLETQLELAKATTTRTQVPPVTQPPVFEMPDPSDSNDQQTPPIVEDEPVVDEPLPDTESPSSPVVLEVVEAYTQALADCRAGWYKQAIAGFEKVLEHPQSHDLRDNAQYWLAECYYAQKQYARALVEFRKIGRDFPKGNKLFDAELKVAHTYYNLNRMEEAKQKLSQLSKDWPQQQYQTQLNTLAEKIRAGSSG